MESELFGGVLDGFGAGAGGCAEPALLGVDPRWWLDPHDPGADLDPPGAGVGFLVVLAAEARLSHESRVRLGRSCGGMGRSVVAVNVRRGDLDQLLLMPVSMREWLPQDHLAFFVLDVVDELDLAKFYAAHRIDGRGGAVYDPAMMLAVLLYAYCTGERSSRLVERRLVEDVGFRVVAGNLRPDHATLARFRRRHQDAIAELFEQVLGLCVKAGLVRTEVVAIDGTKIAADASYLANRDRVALTEELAALDLAALNEVDQERRLEQAVRQAAQRILRLVDGQLADGNYDEALAGVTEGKP